MKNNRVDVIVRHGRLRGVVEEGSYRNSYIAFRGIPYAKPPIGELRFKDPVPPEPWSGVRDASDFGNMSLQMEMITNIIMGDEDCLYLNVYTTDVNSKQKRAVMVWIHSGGFYLGSGNDDMYGPDYIIRKDVVLVTLNYRLGALGFLNLDHEIAAGNQGLKDTLMALRWVQDNVLNFGGDPGNVTIFGESAGGALVHFLALCPLANGLFHKVISQSGITANPWALSDTIKARSFQLAEQLGKRTSDPKIAGEFLKTIDAKKILEAINLIWTDEEKHMLLLIFAPSMDRGSPNPFFLEHPAVTLRRGVKLPFLLGLTKHEGSLFMSFYDVTNIIQKVNSNFKKIIHPKVLSMLRQQSISVEDLRFLYFGNKPMSKETIMNYINLYGDLYFYYNFYEVVDIQMQIGHRSTYIYQFSYDNENSPMKKLWNITAPGPTHSEELNYLFSSKLARLMDFPIPEQDSEDYKMINCITQMWTDFAKTGNPTPAVTDLTPVKWSPLQKQNVYNYLDIDRRLQIETVRKEDLRCSWNNMKHRL